MIYEMRIYEAMPGKLPALNARFANATLRLFARHGIVAVGRDVKEAVVNAIFLERQARANVVVAQLSDTPRVITADEIGRLHGPMVEYTVRWAFYKHLGEHPELPLSW